MSFWLKFIFVAKKVAGVVAKFAPQKVIYGPTYPPNFVFLALAGAEIAAAGHYLPPFSGRVIPRPSTGSVLNTFITMRLSFFITYIQGGGELMQPPVRVFKDSAKTR